MSQTMVRERAVTALKPQDRCDHRACGAQALVRVQFETGLLDFCGHHWRRHEPIAELAGYLSKTLAEGRE